MTDDEVLEYYTNDEREILNDRKRGVRKKKLNMTDDEYINEFMEETE